jgi:hypothetical protein
VQDVTLAGMKRLLLAMLLFCACKSNEQRYCERAEQARLYDPQRPGLCQEEYKSLTSKQRDCLDECLDKTSVMDCANSCDIGERPTFVKVPREKPDRGRP